MRHPLLFPHIALSFFMCCTPGMSAPPAWWTAGNPPVIDPAATDNNKGAANIGQAKWMAKNALDALRAVSDPTADAVEAALVGTGKPIPSWNAPANPAEQAAQRAPLLVGQLKAISAPFFDQLHTSDAAWLAGQLTMNGTSSSGTYYPWTTSIADDSNKSIANIGQLKAVFSLRFETFSGGGMTDADGDGLPDDWEITHFGSTSAYAGSADVEPDGALNLTEYQQGTNPQKRDHPAVGLQIISANGN